MRNADLEREILAANHDPSAYLVYADWLQGQGDVRGELIIRAIQNRDAQAFLDEHRAELLGRFAPSTDHYVKLEWSEHNVKLEWRNGLIQKATLRWHEFGGEAKADPSSAQLEEFLRLDSAALIEELVLGPTAHEDVLMLDELAAPIERVKPPALRTLYLGDTGNWDISTTQTRMPSSDSIRGLRELTLRGGSVTIGEIDLPDLRSFTVETGFLTVPQLTDIANARWPELERLEIWFGDPNYGAKGGVEDLARILAGTGMPKLRTLNLRNCAFADALVAALVDAPVLRQITSLDLSMGNLSERGLATLIDAKAKLRHFTSINLDDNALSDAALARAAELPNAMLGTEHDIEREVPRDPEVSQYTRYVSVGE